MSAETEEIILGAALKVFSEEGYVGAKTRLIAEEAGFSEMTLFRKFKSKENLFDTVLMEQKALILNEVSALSRENKIEDPVLSLSYLIRQLYRLIEDNFPYISIYINESRRTSECILDEFAFYLAGEIQLRFPDVNANIRTLAYNILYTLYYLIFDKNKDYSIVDPDEGLNEYIGHVITILTA